MIGLDILLDTIPSALVGGVAHKRLRLVGDHLPDALTACIGLEAWLHDDPRVDLLLLAASERQLGVLAGTDPAVRLAEELRAHPAWRGAARLAQRSLRLLASASPLPPAIWLEFDTDPARDAVPAPGVFAAVTPEQGAEEARRWKATRTIDDVLTTAEGVAAGGTASGLSEQIRRVAGSGLRIRRVGFLPGYRSLDARLFCSLDEPSQLVPALVACGWRGPADALEHWNAACATWSRATHVGLEVSVAGPSPGVGLEIAVPGSSHPATDSRWRALLEGLCTAGLCTDAKLRALCTLDRSYEAYILTRRRYRQGLHHIKVCVAADGSATAKAYFGAYEI